MIQLVDKNLCTGCSACYSICPKGTIAMEPDEKGFLHPKIDSKHCTECGLCVKTCPIMNNCENENNLNPSVYAAWSKNDETRRNSTSGGIFAELAESVLNMGGYVIGVRYTKNHLVEHYVIHDIREIEILRQSKYIQSDKKDIFKTAKKLLEEGQTLLFVGSPCEVGGLIHFLRKKYDKLYLCDFVCRGTNSPKAYNSYLSSLEEKYHAKVKTVWFKNKTFGWNRFSTKVIFENGTEYLKDRYSDYYMRGYIEKNLYMRSCCENCNYKKLPRVSDITLADFWGIGKSNPKLDPDKGTSMVILNSWKGEELFASIKNNIEAMESNFDTALRGNVSLMESAKSSPHREEFFNRLQTMDFDKAIKKYMKRGLRGWKNKLCRDLKGFLKRCLNH